MKKQDKNEINQLFEEFKSGKKEVLEEIYNKYHIFPSLILKIALSLHFSQNNPMQLLAEDLAGIVIHQAEPIAVVGGA